MSVAVAAAPSRWKSVTLWVVRGLLALAFAAAGAAKLYGVPMLVEEFEHIGLGQWFRYLTRVWTKRLGSGRTKVLLLHGGPAFTHSYLEAMESFLPEAGIEMYYYDQLGCGNSDIPDDTSLWTIERYVEEVEEVRHGLGLDQFVLYGQSWGGMLAIEYALKYQKNLKGLVVSNMTAGIQAYLKRTAAINDWLPADKRAKLGALEAASAYDSPEYMQIMMEDLYPLMVCRIKPWPEPLSRAFRLANLKIYEQMQGKNSASPRL